VADGKALVEGQRQGQALFEAQRLVEVLVEGRIQEAEMVVCEAS